MEVFLRYPEGNGTAFLQGSEEYQNAGKTSWLIGDLKQTAEDGDGNVGKTTL